MQAIDEIYTENDNTYVNISFVNSLNNPDKTIVLNYNATKTAPVLDDASQYYATVVKFDIPLSALPVAIFPIVPNQSNPNLSTIQIGIRYGGMNYLENVIYVSQTDLPAPSQVGSLRQVITPYYFLYSYDQMIEMINTALSAAYTAAGLANTTTIQGIAPYFIYNPVTSLFSLIVNNSFNTIPGTGPQVIFNYPLFQYLDKFDGSVVPPLIGANTLYSYNVYGLVNESFAYNYYGITPPTFATPPFSVMNPIPQPYFYKITQNSVAVASWNPIRKLLFLSSTMPIKYEIIPASNTATAVNNNNNGVLSSLNVITDFTPQIEYPADSSSVAYYAASGYGGYRLADMTTNQPLYKIDIKVVWQDIEGNIYDVIIDEYSQANIKLGFIRKSLYKHF